MKRSKKDKKRFGKQKKSVTIVSSALNEESALNDFFQRITNIMDQESEYKWDCVFFDNGSSDKTWNVISNWAASDKRILGFQMSRTFALDAALSAGLQLTDSDAVVVMTSDLQDPPELISKMLRAWESGYPNVVIRITKREAISYLRKLLTSIFYRINEWASDGLIPSNVSDFRLMDRSVYKHVREIPESGRFLRGVVAWTGFPSYFIDLERPDRHSGKSKVRYGNLIRYSIQGILSFSKKPLNAITKLAFVCASISLVTLVALSILWLSKGVPFAGFGTIVGLMFLIFSITTLILSIIAEYISLIYTEVRRQPNQIIWKSTSD